MCPQETIQNLWTAIPPDELAAVMNAFSDGKSTEDRVRAVEQVLHATGQEWRDQVGIWIADLLSVEKLVPESYRHWRPLVHDSMAFVASRISDSRVAPKIVQQIELPQDTPEEIRLGLIIAKTPGLQKLGQVLARTRRLSAPLRRELQKLENGIADIKAPEVREIVVRQLGPRMQAYFVEVAAELLSEASVSAIIEFTWLNPSTGKREQGVFKVMKPHVPECYAEDLRLLQQLAEHLASRSGEYGIASREVIDTLEEVRLLLEREVDFRREQATLAEVTRVYKRSGTHAPKPIPELCTDTITAMSVERGVKVTDAFRRQALSRRGIAAQIVESLLADPIFSPEENAVFHADPHAGNLLYDERRKELIVLDWALTGRLSRDHRRQLGRLIAMMTFRDARGVRESIRALSSGESGSREKDVEIINACVDAYFRDLPHVCSLGAIDAMRLLDQIGLEGVRFPASLVLIRKVLFTLDGVLYDITGGDVRIDTIVARAFLGRLLSLVRIPSPFQLNDYIAIQRSAFLYASGLWCLPG
jgi:ubiquinone biosynthesis protein